MGYNRNCEDRESPRQRMFFLIVFLIPMIVLARKIMDAPTPTPSPTSAPPTLSLDRKFYSIGDTVDYTVSFQDVPEEGTLIELVYSNSTSVVTIVSQTAIASFVRSGSFVINQKGQVFVRCISSSMPEGFSVITVIPSPPPSPVLAPTSPPLGAIPSPPLPPPLAGNTYDNTVIVKSDAIVVKVGILVAILTFSWLLF